MYPPVFSMPKYTVTSITEDDESAAGRLITTVSHMLICIYLLFIWFNNQTTICAVRHYSVPVARHWEDCDGSRIGYNGGENDA